MTRVNQGLFSTTMEAEKRDPGNEVDLKAFMFFKGVYTDDWMVPWVVVRKVFLALLFPNLIVSLVTAVNEIINQQHAATNCNRQIFLPCTI